MKALITTVILMIVMPHIVFGDYGTPHSTNIYVFAPWVWDNAFANVQPVPEAVFGIRGYSVPDDFTDADLDTTAIRVSTWVDNIRSAPGMVMIIGHGDVVSSTDDGWFTVCCYIHDEDGLAARDTELNSAQGMYGAGNVRRYDDDKNNCYNIEIKDTLLSANDGTPVDYSGTFGSFWMCYGKQHAMQAMPGAKCTIGYDGVTDTATLHDEFWDIINDMGDDQDPKSIGEVKVDKTIEFVDGSDQTLQIVPWMVDNSIAENGNEVSQDGLDFWIEVRGEIPHNNFVITSSHFFVESQYWSWDSYQETHKLHATIKAISNMGENFYGAGNIYINCDLVPSSNCSGLVLNGSNDNQIQFQLQNGVNPAAQVGGFSVAADVARWTAIPFNTDHFVVEGGEHPVIGPWQELVQVPIQTDSADYSVDVSSSPYPFFRLSEVELNGNILIHRRAKSISSAVVPTEVSPVTVESLEATLSTLNLQRKVKGEVASENLRIGAGKAVVFFTMGSLADGVQTYVADYWRDRWGYDVYVESVDDYPTPEPDNRDAWRAHMKERIAYYYNAKNVRYVHFIGDANDWEMWSQPWPEGEWADYKTTYDEVGYAPEGQPEFDLIPCFYVIDDLPPDKNTAGWTWWIPTDAPYKDVDGDGSPDIALGRWPVHDLAGLLAQAVTMQAYNDHGLVDNYHNVEIWTGELYFQSPSDSLLVLQSAQAMAAEMPPEIPVSYMYEADYPDLGLRNLEAANRLNCAYGITVLGMFADNSGRRYPCKQFDNTIYASPVFTMDLLRDTPYTPYIMAMSCGSADFPGTTKPSARGPICQVMGEWPNKGFIALLGPICGTWQHANNTIGAYATRELWAGNNPEDPRSLAMSWTAAAVALHADFGDDYGTMRTLLGYDFLGDPLSPLRRPMVVSAAPENGIPSRAELGVNYPNPFNPITTISFATVRQGTVSLSIYDLRGCRVRMLVHKDLLAGAHKIVWRGEDDAGSPVASGIYFCKLETGGISLSRKLTLIK